MESLNCPSDYHKRLVVVKKRLLNGPSLLLRDEILFQYQTQKPLVALENTHIAVCSREKRKKNRETISNWKRYWFLKNKMYFSGFLFENKTNGFACCGRLNEMEKQLAEFVFFPFFPRFIFFVVNSPVFFLFWRKRRWEETTTTSYPRVRKTENR